MSLKVQEREANLENEIQRRSKELDIQRAKIFHNSKMATLVEMAGRIAHEINNPLTTISLGAEASLMHLEKQGLGDEKSLDYLRRIKYTSERISQIVSGMRSFHRQNDQEPKKKESVKDIIDRTLLLCEASLKEKGISFKIHDFQDQMIFCREAQIRQILLNLIQNSREALEQSPVKNIDLMVQTQDHKVNIIIEDTGIGIPIENRENIMNPFFTTKDVGDGPGLGLFISQGLAQSNDGKLIYDATSIKTRFILELPLALT
jgi:C4-dicarboxylate-specific signal transduction histidine kinase